jgi:hypothetical protein
MHVLSVLVLCFLLQASSPVPGKITNTPTSGCHETNNHEKPDNCPTSDKPTRANANNAPSAAEQGNYDSNKNTQQTITISKLPSVDVTRDWIDKLNLFFSVLLVISTTLTLFAVWYQARETARATKEMARATKAAQCSAAATAASVLLQKTAMQQWVATGPWRTKYYEWQASLVIEFEISNTTALPLTLTVVKMAVADTTQQKVFLESRNIMLAPKELYTAVYDRFKLDDETRTKYSDTGAELNIFCCIEYIDAFKACGHRTFSGILRCSSKGKTSFKMQALPNNPYGKEDENPRQQEKN